MKLSNASSMSCHDFWMDSDVFVLGNERYIVMPKMTVLWRYAASHDPRRSVRIKKMMLDSVQASATCSSLQPCTVCECSTARYIGESSII